MLRSCFLLWTNSLLRKHHTVCVATLCGYSTLYQNRKDKKQMEAIQKYDYFLVLDFEATCNKPKQTSPMEVIEFPVVKLNAKTFKSEEVFHSYVRPRVHPVLSDFCTDLTGILQDMVDNEPEFDVVFARFQKWLEEVDLLNEDQQPTSRFTFVTCGNWDLQMMLPDQCKLSKLRIPLYMRSWINIKKAFKEATGDWPKSLYSMLDYLKIEPVGNLHSGIDDCKNIVMIVKELSQKYNYVFRNTSSEW